MDKFYVYILLDKTGNHNYTGKTNNLGRRLAEHNQGKHVSTKAFSPWKMVYTEEFSSEQEARKREAYLKSGSGRELRKSILDKYRGVEQPGSSSGS